MKRRLNLKNQSIKLLYYKLLIKFIKNFLMKGFIDLIDINVIKSLPRDIIDDNWIELNYLYNKALVEGDLEMAEVLSGYELQKCLENLIFYKLF